MARGSSYGDNSPLPAIAVTPQTIIPRRATRELAAINDEEERETQVVPLPSRHTGILTYSLDEVEHPLARHSPWLTRLLICIVCIVVGSMVLITAGMYQRPGESHLVNDPYVQSFAI